MRRLATLALAGLLALGASARAQSLAYTAALERTLAKYGSASEVPESSVTWLSETHGLDEDRVMGDLEAGAPQPQGGLAALRARLRTTGSGDPPRTLAEARRESEARRKELQRSRKRRRRPRSSLRSRREARRPAPEPIDQELEELEDRWLSAPIPTTTGEQTAATTSRPLTRKEKRLAAREARKARRAAAKAERQAARARRRARAQEPRPARSRPASRRAALSSSPARSYVAPSVQGIPRARGAAEALEAAGGPRNGAGSYAAGIDNLLLRHGSVGGVPYSAIAALADESSREPQVVLHDLMERSRELRGD